MGVSTAVLLFDDGELDDVQQMLQEMAIPFARIRGGADLSKIDAPRDLLIATPRRIDAALERLAESEESPVCVMVVNEDSNALRSQLRRNGFDFLVRRPVHPEALRLMLLHCCYKGEERRREPRVAVGIEVSYTIGLATRVATLVDLSSRGCRLMSRHRVERGKRIEVLVPEVIDAGEPSEMLVLPARVIHVEGTESGGVECFRMGLSFERLDEEAKESLALIIEDRAQGPATLRTDTPAPGERRQQTRVAYSQTVPAFGERALRVLVGRDLSVGGMRVEPQSELWLGDHLQLAIYAEAGDEPMLVSGRVERSDGERGIVISFDPLDAKSQARLERLVANLPTVESLQEGEVEAMGTVLGEILLTDVAPKK